ncbi:hypothetical protein AB0C69_10605 [Actinomadura sp. NPDC048032]|uniref:hypothetical protein n=1 Tax=Actinomadura sp. NPDC048032 TaxID=3155747 RepID=UPI0033D41C10
MPASDVLAIIVSVVLIVVVIAEDAGACGTGQSGAADGAGHPAASNKDREGIERGPDQGGTAHAPCPRISPHNSCALAQHTHRSLGKDGVLRRTNFRRASKCGETVATGRF